MSDRDELQAQLDRLDRVSGMDIFRMRGMRGEPTGFMFVAPGVMLSSRDVSVRIENQQWHLTLTENGQTYEASADDEVAAILRLIAKRWGVEL